MSRWDCNRKARENPSKLNTDDYRREHDLRDVVLVPRKTAMLRALRSLVLPDSFGRSGLGWRDFRKASRLLRKSGLIKLRRAGKQLDTMKRTVMEPTGLGHLAAIAGDLTPLRQPPPKTLRKERHGARARRA